MGNGTNPQSRMRNIAARNLETEVSYDRNVSGRAARSWSLQVPTFKLAAPSAESASDVFVTRDGIVPRHPGATPFSTGSIGN